MHKWNLWKIIHTHFLIWKIIDCKSGRIRLIGNGSSVSQGRVEMCYNNQYGTVCSDSWDTNEAIVICSQLGFFGKHLGLFSFLNNIVFVSCYRGINSIQEWLLWTGNRNDLTFWSWLYWNWTFTALLFFQKCNWFNYLQPQPRCWCGMCNKLMIIFYM